LGEPHSTVDLHVLSSQLTAPVAAAPRKRSRLADQGRGKKSSAAVVVPSRQIKVADSELLTDWERKRQVGRARAL
jgi:hypothetical protein